MTPLGDRHSRRELAQAFSTHRAELAEALYQAVRESEYAAGALPNHLAEIFEWWQAAVFTAIDLASEWLRTPDELRGDLFSGWISNLDHEALRPVGAQALSAPTVLLHVKPRWQSILEAKVSARASQILCENIDRIIAPLSRPKCKDLKILIVGDCLVHEILACLAGPCARARIALDSVYAHNPVPAIARNEIRTFGRNDFNVVFFSPFSYTFAPEYGQMLLWKAALWSRSKFFGALDQMLEEVSLTVRTLVEQFSCPIYVHNTAGIVQTFNFFTGAAKNAVSLRNRIQARQMINRRINRLLADQAFDGRVRLLDEESLRRMSSGFALGRVVFQGSVYHPTPLSIGLARSLYMDAIGSAAFLTAKKVVVCDLDNTLWNGIIGEGPVEHFTGRQRILKGLRNRGVLLSINSKNDHASVNFSGALLQMDDFVAPRINWLPKVPNMASMIEELNLKEKDFVFIDDRPDELERVGNAFPAMTVLDATDEKTWRWLSHWEEHLPAEPREDRTRLYHERAARERFISRGSEQQINHEDEVAALTSLQLSVKIEHATRSSDLKRAVELVNRTNQFNLCGSRVTMAELERGLGADRWVITAAAQDKFGSMGVVGVMLVRRKPEAFEIPVFVLSCRVFGFGIEYALLRAVSELAPADCRLVGLYAETPHNQPCREFYSKAGLRWDGKVWVGAINNLAANPSWLTIESLAQVGS